MIKKLLSSMKKKKPEPLAYSQVVNSPDKTQMVEMLRIAAKRANQDQRELAGLAK